MPAHPTVISLKRLEAYTRTILLQPALVAESKYRPGTTEYLQWGTPITEFYTSVWNYATWDPQRISVYDLYVRMPFDSTSRKVNWKEFLDNKPSALSLTTERESMRFTTNRNSPTHPVAIWQHIGQWTRVLKKRKTPTVCFGRFDCSMFRPH